MTEKCAWIINLGHDDASGLQVAAQLSAYGLKPRGQRWATGDDKAWMAHAEEAARQNASVIILLGTPAELSAPRTRLELSLFRLALQTHRGAPVNGMTLNPGGGTAGAMAAAAENPATNRIGLLEDWLTPAAAGWPAKAVARAHAPTAPDWPVRLGMHAHERLGAWLEVHPQPGAEAQGACVGVAGEGASINFHAVGPAGALPERSVNEYELQGIQFEIGELAFNAWALQNRIAPDQSYFVRVEGLPHCLAIGTLPAGQLEEVHVVSLVS